jgi:hypothetical protein
MFQHKNLKAIQNRFEEKTGISLSESTLLVERKPAVRRKPLLVAAALVLIVASLTGVAAIAGNRKEKSPPVWGDEVVGETDENGFSVSGNLYTFYVNIPLEQGAPATVEEFYLPQVPEGYSQFYGALHGGLHTPYFVWKTQEDKTIAFEQVADLDYGEDNIPDGMVNYPVSILSDSGEPFMTKATYGGMEGTFIPDSMKGRNYFFWSDGRYAYQLYVSDGFTDEELHELVCSVGRVEDIRPYLISMTEEEIEAALRKN